MREVSRHIAIVAMFAVVGLTARVAMAQECTLPRVLIVLDKSSSMTDPISSGGTKWDAAASAIETIVNAYEDRIEFGLMVYPIPDECGPGAVVDDVARFNADDIVAALGGAPPASGNYTPIKQTLPVVAGYAPLLDTDYSRYVLLITDGYQDCQGTDPEADPYQDGLAIRQSTVDLYNLGIQTYALGLETSVNGCLLARIAMHGGTVRDGCPMASPDDSCNPLDEDPAEQACYFQANDLSGFETALATIAGEVADERCDGIDNDCDGATDEGFTDTDVDTEADCVDDDDDGDGSLDGDDCAPLDGTIYPGATERCNGVDDDCDSDTDEGFTDTNIDGEADCVDDDDDGDGSLDDDDCEPLNALVYPGQNEVCNDGLDNDCNGFTDEDCECSPGDRLPCGTDEGVCVAGDRICQATSEWGTECVGATFGGAEECDGEDDDCDGTTDEGFDDLDGDLVADCVDDDDDGDGSHDGDDCAPQDPAIYPGQVEACDAIDNDCDGQTDEDFPDTDDDGTPDCRDDDDDNDGTPDLDDCAPLDPEKSAGASETCDGVDNDCDGQTDEDLGGAPCASTCGDGTMVCEGGELVCSTPDPTAEVCDGADNDCNGETDEGEALCLEGFTCQEGQCVEGGSTKKGSSASSCSGGGGGSVDLLLVLAFLALVFALRRRSAAL